MKFVLWFLEAMLILEMLLLFFLHTGIVDSWIEEELGRFKRGETAIGMCLRVPMKRKPCGILL